MAQTFVIEHLFGRKFHFTIEQLKQTYRPMIEWLEENCEQYRLTPTDNAAYSDVNEDPWIGYIVEINNDDEALAFKLKWL